MCSLHKSLYGVVFPYKVIVECILVKPMEDNPLQSKGIKE